MGLCTPIHGLSQGGKGTIWGGGAKEDTINRSEGRENQRGDVLSLKGSFPSKITVVCQGLTKSKGGRRLETLQGTTKRNLQ